MLYYIDRLNFQYKIAYQIHHNTYYILPLCATITINACRSIILLMISNEITIFRLYFIHYKKAATTFRARIISEKNTTRCPSFLEPPVQLLPNVSIISALYKFHIRYKYNCDRVRRCRAGVLCRTHCNRTHTNTHI